MSTPTEPSGLLPPGPGNDFAAPPNWPVDPSAQDGRAPLPAEWSPRRSLSLQIAQDRTRLLALGAVTLGMALVLALVVLLSPMRTLLAIGQSTPTRVPAATPTPAERFLFTEPLTSTNDRNWPNDDKCNQRADGYYITANVVCILSKYTPPPDVNISVDVKQVSGLVDASYGIAFRRTSAGNFYTFEIDSSGRWYFYKATNNQLKLLAGSTTSRAIHKGLNAANTLAVRALGAHFVFLVNGQIVGAADDSAFGSGQVGLDGNDQIEVAYTNFKITKTVS